MDREPPGGFERARYRDRDDAARAVLAALPDLGEEPPVVLALPRGGVPIGAVLAQALGADLDLVLVRKVGAPRNPELAVGAVTGPEEADLVVNDRVTRALNLSRDDVRRLAAPEIEELARRRAVYLGSRAPVPVAGRTVLVVDDGIATGTTALAALRALRGHKPARIILAVPVASEDSLAVLRPHVDDIVCPLPRLTFGAIGAAYVSFPQVADAEVVALMQAARHGA